MENLFQILVRHICSGWHSCAK